MMHRNNVEMIEAEIAQLRRQYEDAIETSRQALGAISALQWVLNHVEVEMVTVYRPDGTPVEKNAIDARECVEHLGFTYEPPAPEHHAHKRGRPAKEHIDEPGDGKSDDLS